MYCSIHYFSFVSLKVYLYKILSCLNFKVRIENKFLTALIFLIFCYRIMYIVLPYLLWLNKKKCSEIVQYFS